LELFSFQKNPVNLIGLEVLNLLSLILCNIHGFLLIELKLRFNSNYAHGFAVSEARDRAKFIFSPLGIFRNNLVFTGLLELKLRFNSILPGLFCRYLSITS
jgi:hypothetical protein